MSINRGNRYSPHVHLARLKGFEPLAYCLEGSCSIQLSYRRISTLHGAGDGNRTHATSLEGWDSTIELHPQSFVPDASSNMISHIHSHCQDFFPAFSLFLK
jgi:hypothetical protein